MIAGCVVDNRRYNGSTCCSRYFIDKKILNEFGSCTMTLQNNIKSETIASSQRGFTILVHDNEDDKISTHITFILRSIIHRSMNILSLNLNCFSLLDFDTEIISPVISEKLAKIFTVSDNAVVTYGALLNEIYLIESAAAAMVSLKVTLVFNDSFKYPNTSKSISFCHADR